MKIRQKENNYTSSPLSTGGYKSEKKQTKIPNDSSSDVPRKLFYFFLRKVVNNRRKAESILLVSKLLHKDSVSFCGSSHVAKMTNPHRGRLSERSVPLCFMCHW